MKPCHARVFALVASGSLFMSACGAREKNKDDNNASGLEEARLPDARSVSLTSLGRSTAGSSLNLTAAEGTRSCDNPKSLALFGAILGGTCDLVNGLEHFLYGDRTDRNTDGEISCADYPDQSVDRGILPTLLCDAGVRRFSKIESYHAGEGANENAVSFRDFSSSDATTAVGSWTATGGNELRYPANLRIWNRPANADLKGLLAMTLSGISTGSFSFDAPESTRSLAGDASFSGLASTADCLKTPSATTCHSARFRIIERNAQGEFATASLVDVMGNAREQASLIIVEGKYQLSEARALATFTSDPSTNPAFVGTREVYFRIVQKGGQVWGSLDFKDAAGNSIVPDAGVRALRDGLTGEAYSGLCLDIATNLIAACREISPKDYDALWKGDAAFPRLESYAMSPDFSDVPARGLILAK